jgi:lipoate-protein ligase B
MSGLHVVDAGTLGYRPAWELQLSLHERVLAGEFPAGVLMLVEHPAVITIGRRADAQRHLLASPALLAARNIELVETDRGGDITFHGLGQLVAYPIINLNTYGLNLHSYMRLLEEAVIRTLATFTIAGVRAPGATGVWISEASTPTESVTACGASCAAGLAKICAMGVKLRRWVTLHGLALNVSTDLSCFQLINPCGLSRPVTSMQQLLPADCPSMAQVKAAMLAAFAECLQAS